MDFLHLKIITPKKIVREEDIKSATIPTVDGEITILPLHENLFSLLKEGIVKIKKNDSEEFMAIGGGYAETDGENLTILVSLAYHQHEINESMIAKATENAKKILDTSSDEAEKAEAMSMLRRVVIDSKLLKKRKRSL